MKYSVKKCNKLKAFSIEESETAKEYARLGFKGLAGDEARHSRKFKKEIRRGC